MSWQAASVRTCHAESQKQKKNSAMGTRAQPRIQRQLHPIRRHWTPNRPFPPTEILKQTFHPSEEVTTPPPLNTPYQLPTPLVFFLKAEESAFALGRTAGE